MVEIISVRFKEGGKHYYFNPNGAQFQPGEGVIVETTRGTEFGECVQGNTPIDEMELTAPLRPVLRRATLEDELTREKNKEKEAKALEICQQKILEHGLEMKLVDAEWSFEGNKVLFFFTAEGRVDFRALVKDLASAIHARIELRQIGVRDEAKMLGGLGICGRPFCCSQFLDEFQPVSIKMAKTQNLSLNPTKISGTCGRLMCCLKYEQEAYEDLVKTSPKPESFVETPDGAGTVSSVNLLRQTVQVRLDSAPETPKCYHNCELCVIRNGKGKRPEGYVEPPLEELAKLRKPQEPDETPDLKGSASPLAAALEAVFNGETPQYEGVGGPAQEPGPPPLPEKPGRPLPRRGRGPGGRPEPGIRPGQGEEAPPGGQAQGGPGAPRRRGQASPGGGREAQLPSPPPPPSQRRRGRQAPERRGVLSTPSAAEPSLLGLSRLLPIGKTISPHTEFQIGQVPAPVVG